MTPASDRLGDGARRIVSGVVRDFLGTTGRSGLHLVGGGPGERTLAAAWLSDLVNEETDDSLELRVPAGGSGPFFAEPWWDEEAERFRARVGAHRMNGEVAHLANRTYLLLAGRLPPERVLPLGDVRASEVRALAGTPLLPPPFHSLADDPAALEELEGAIEAWIAGKGGTAEDTIPATAVWSAGSLGGVLRSGFLARTRDRIVPKLCQATPWIDLDI